MSTLVLTPEDVREALPMSACIERVADALAAYSRGDATNPLRWPLFLPERDGAPRILGLMPGALPVDAAGGEAVGLKVVTVHPGNHGTPYDTHQGVVLLFDPAHGTPLAILDGSEVTAIRTAAASGVATRTLAREDATVLALLGSGVQARTHLEAMRAVRPITEVRVFSPSAEARARFASRESARHGIRVDAVDSARDAVEGADIVCATTSAREPVLHGDWLARGAHVNAVGACTPDAREVDTRTIERARVYVDSLESAAQEAGDLLIPGRIDAVVGELGAVLLGRADGRTSPDDITLFESLGIAVEDLAAAALAVARAEAAGIGTRVALGGMRDA